MSFQDLQLHPALLRAVSACGFETPTEIQQKAIPVVLAGSDVIASAQTGTGKTAAFVLPALHRLNDSQRPAGSDMRKPRMLVLEPTRELAAQVAESVRGLGQHLPFRSAVIFGGVGYDSQVKALRTGLDIVVATPGRLLDHAGQRTIDLSGIEILVIDEADRMLDMGFIHDIRKVVALLPQKRQNLLFSATFPDEIRELIDRMMNKPARIEAARKTMDAESVSQVVHFVDRERKRELLSHLIKTGDWKQVLVFTRTKHGANKLSEQLGKCGISAAAIHGNKSQTARTRALADFKDGNVRVLVATDIAARGIDIDRLPHVVNFELPHVPEDYVHRIGRTGRAGQSGEAVSLVSSDEHPQMAGIQRLLKRDISAVAVEGFEPSLNTAPRLADNREPRQRSFAGAEAGRNGRKWTGGKSASQNDRYASRDGQPAGQRRPGNATPRWNTGSRKSSSLTGRD